MSKIDSPMVREGELVKDAAREIAYHVADSGEWHTIVFVTRSLSRYAEEELTVDRSSGVDRSLGAPRMTWKKIAELREVMYREGAGTWFSMKLTILKQEGRTRMHVSYNYDADPQWDTRPASSLYTADLIKYPRDDSSIPDWLGEQVARARVEYPGEYAEYERARRQRREMPPTVGGAEA